MQDVLKRRYMWLSFFWEGRVFLPRLGSSGFFIVLILSAALWALGSTQPPTEMSKVIPLKARCGPEGG